MQACIIYICIWTEISVVVLGIRLFHLGGYGSEQSGNQPWSSPPTAFPAPPLVSFFLLFQTAVVLVSCVLVPDLNPASVAMATPSTRQRCVQARPSSLSSSSLVTGPGAEFLQGLFHHFHLPVGGTPSSPRAFSCDHLTCLRGHHAAFVQMTFPRHRGGVLRMRISESVSRSLRPSAGDGTRKPDIIALHSDLTLAVQACAELEVDLTERSSKRSGVSALWTPSGPVDLYPKHSRNT